MLRIPNTWADFKNSNISSDATHTGGIFPNTPILILCIKVNKLQLRLCLTKNNCQKIYILKAQFERCILLISVDRKEKYALRRSFFEDKPGWWHGRGIWIWKYFENPTQEAFGSLIIFAILVSLCPCSFYTSQKKGVFSFYECETNRNCLCSVCCTFWVGKMGKHYGSMVTYSQFVNWLEAKKFEAF